MNVGDWIGVVIGGLTLLSGGYFSARALASTQRADQAQTADRRRQEIASARAEERANCEARVNDLLRERDDLARERDERARERDAANLRADNLQNLINQWRIGGSP